MILLTTVWDFRLILRLALSLIFYEEDRALCITDDVMRSLRQDVLCCATWKMIYKYIRNFKKLSFNTIQSFTHLDGHFLRVYQFSTSLCQLRCYAHTLVLTLEFISALRLPSSNIRNTRFIELASRFQLSFSVLSKSSILCCQSICK